MDGTIGEGLDETLQRLAFSAVVPPSGLCLLALIVSCRVRGGVRRCAAAGRRVAVAIANGDGGGAGSSS